MDILEKLHANQIQLICIDHQMFHEINYNMLELLYLGYPLIHNCEFLKSNRLYYTNHNVDDGSINLSNVLRDNCTLYDNHELLNHFDPCHILNTNIYKNIL